MKNRLRDKTILVIDDADGIRSFLRISMEAQGASFFEADTANQGMHIAKEQKPDLIVLDLGLPDRDGLDILPEIKALEEAPQVIILSVRKERSVIEKATELGADDYLTKPFMMDSLMDRILEKINH